MKRFFVVLTVLILLLPPFAALTPKAMAQTQPIKVLLDIGHSEFILPGNSQILIQSLVAKGYVVDSFSGTVTTSVLSSYNVFIIGIAWSSFTSSEMQAITNFEQNGGGLLLVGVGWSWVDYHPSSTINAYPMNQIATNFGAFFNPDIITDPTDYTGDPSSAVFHTPFIYSHPATVGISHVGAVGMLFGSITVQSGTILIAGDDDAYGGYIHGSPYPNPGSHPPLLAAITQGSGKVIVIGHDSIFVDSHINEYDNKRLALNIIDWLAQGSELPLDKTAIMIDPFYSSLDSLTILNSDISRMSIFGYWTTAGYSISWVKDAAVTVDLLKTSLRHGIVFWRGHGVLAQQGVVLTTGEKYTNPVIPSKYSDDFNKGRLCWVTDPGPGGSGYCIAITPKFIDFYYGSNRFPYSLIYVESCYGLADTSMAQSFTSNGAAAYMGFPNYIFPFGFLTIGSDSVSKSSFYDFCIKNYNVKQVIGDPLASMCPLSILTYYGDPYLKLTTNSFSTSNSFIVAVQCPISLYLTDPEGQHIGIDSSTGTVVGNIPNAIYLPMPDEQIIWIPEALVGTYDVKLLGTGDGSFKLEIGTYSVLTTATQSYDGTIVLGQILTSTMTITSTSSSSTAPIRLPASALQNKLAMSNYIKMELQWLKNTVSLMTISDSASINKNRLNTNLIKKALTSTLEIALSQLDKSDTYSNNHDVKKANLMLATTKLLIDAFILQVKAQNGKAISQADAINLLINSKNIISDISKAQQLPIS